MGVPCPISWKLWEQRLRFPEKKESCLKTEVLTLAWVCSLLPALWFWTLQPPLTHLQAEWRLVDFKGSAGLDSLPHIGALSVFVSLKLPRACSSWAMAEKQKGQPYHSYTFQVPLPCAFTSANIHWQKQTDDGVPLCGSGKFTQFLGGETTKSQAEDEDKGEGEELPAIFHSILLLSQIRL